MKPSGWVRAALGVGMVTAAARGDESRDLESARRFFAEAEEVSRQDAGRLWGLPLYGPILLVDPVGKRVLANQHGQEATLEDRDGVFVGPVPAGVFAANAAQEWAGTRWTTIVWQAIPRSTYRRRALFAHEMFHRIQPDLDLAPQSPSNAHLDTEAGRYWLRLELRALSEALLQEDDRRDGAIEDALLFRARRRALFDGAAASEARAELNEAWRSTPESACRRCPPAPSTRGSPSASPTRSATRARTRSG